MSRVEELAHPCFVNVSKVNRDTIYDAKRPLPSRFVDAEAHHWRCE